MANDFSALLKNATAKNLLDFYAQNGHEARFIGGCVRDALLNRSIVDIDLATTIAPQDNFDLLQKNGIRAIPTGLDHGTLTVLVDDQKFEVTTLRKDVETDGRHAAVSFTDNWEADAKRRDFTINALSLDRNGRLYDYCNGLKDIKTKTLAFIGDPEHRIQEDYLRVMRYFRFLSVLDWDSQDDASLKACIKFSANLSKLSRERVQGELFKTMLGKKCVPVITKMAEHGILSSLIPNLNKESFKDLVEMENEYKQPDALRRLIALSGSTDVTSLDQIIVLTGRDKKRLQALQGLQLSMTLFEQLYYSGRQAVLDDRLLRGQTDDLVKILSWQAPVFPLRADDIISLGHSAGSMIGGLMKKAECFWVQNNFQPSRIDLLDYLRRN